MSRISIILLIGILGGAALIAGCTDVHQGSPLPAGQDDPLVGVWVSREAGLTTIYRFWENGTFDAWSRSEDVRPKYVYTSKGNWEVRGVHEYSTEGEHIGYGEVTALAIRRILTLVHDPTSDTLTIAQYKNQMFTRQSHDPDAPLDPSGSLAG